MSSEERILAAVALKDREKVTGAVPIFLVEDQVEQQRVCLLLSRILKGMAHDLENGTYIIVKH